MWTRITLGHLQPSDVVCKPGSDPDSIAASDVQNSDLSVSPGFVASGLAGLTVAQIVHDFKSICRVEVWRQVSGELARFLEQKPRRTNDRPKDPPPPGKRGSISGLLFAGSTEKEWEWKRGLGWLHKSEETWFQYHYGECAATGRFCRKSELVRTGYGFSIGKSALGDQFAMCESSGMAFLVGDLVPARDAEGAHIKIGRQLIDERVFFLDEDAKEYFPSVSRVQIDPAAEGEKRKFISAFTLNRADGAYAHCSSCGKHYTRASLVTIQETGGRYCQRCYTHQMRKIAIREFNHKGYPPPIYTKPENRITDRNAKMIAKYKKAMGLGEEGFVRLYGLEVETEMDRKHVKKAGMDRFSLAMAVKKALGEDFVITKEDGTLIMNGKYSDGKPPGSLYAGFEIVSAPADLAEHRKRWPILEQQPWHKHLRAWDTTTCGLHIHVSRASLTPMMIGRILYFVNLPGNKKFIQKVAGRSEEKYTKFHQKKITDSLYPDRVINPEEEENYNRRRRVAVNVSNRHTIEFRIFRGTVRSCHILRNIEFVDALIQFCYPCERSLNELREYKKFISFVASRKKEWPEFYRWLEHHKMVPKAFLPRAKPYTEKDRRGTTPPELAEPEVFPEPISSLKASQDAEEEAGQPQLLPVETLVAFGEADTEEGEDFESDDADNF
jgi:hypothetical protein